MQKIGKSWYSDFWYNGERFKKSWGPISKTAAAEKDQKYRVEVREGKHDLKARKARFETFAEKYLEHARTNKKPSSARRNEVSVNMLRPHFEGVLLSKIHPFKVEQYKKTRKDQGANVATINRDVACLRNMMNLAISWGYLKANPIRGVKTFREDNERMWVLSAEEERRLLEECEKRKQRVKYLADLVRFALHTGMRLEEIFSLKWVDVHSKERYILVTATKTHQNRRVPINDTLAGVLRRRKKAGGDHVFADHQGERLRSLTSAFWTAVAKAKLVRDGQRFRFHDLRHTFGSRLGMNGFDLKTIMEIMGHKTPTVAMRYQHPSPPHKLDAVRSLDEHARKSTPAQEEGEKTKVIQLDAEVVSGLENR